MKNYVFWDVTPCRMIVTDVSKVGINGWRGRARDREVWRRIGMEAKAHPGL
jgi:hypothetical protein